MKIVESIVKSLILSTRFVLISNFLVDLIVSVALAIPIPASANDKSYKSFAKR